MGRGIIHHEGAFNLWSTIVDAPIYESALTEKQLTELVRRESGEMGVMELPQRLSRARCNGTSYAGMTLDEVISCNRAGENESKLSREDLIARYLTLPK